MHTHAYIQNPHLFRYEKGIALSCSPRITLALLVNYPHSSSDFPWALLDFVFAPVGAIPWAKSSPFSGAGQGSGHKCFWAGPAPGRAQPLWKHWDGNSRPLSPFFLSCSWKPISCFNLILLNRNTLLAWRMRNYCIIGSNHTEHKKPFKVIKLLPSPFLYFFSAPRWWAVYLCHHNSRRGSPGNSEPFSARAHAERAELRQTLSFLAAKALELLRIKGSNAITPVRK